ncbi:MAG: DUF3987 domain-containing protein [Candidatus Nanopelagicales bacterium]
MNDETRYRYEDESGELLYCNVRAPGKAFRLEPANGAAGEGAMNGVPRVLYRLPALISAVKKSRRVWIVEGEKDANTLHELGEVATTSGGATSWRPEFAQHFKGARVTICPDQDEPGRKYAAEVFAALHGVAKSVEILKVASGKDISDHVRAGFEVAELEPVAIADLYEWEPLNRFGSVRELPEWPTGCLPPGADEYVSAVAAETCTDPRLAGTIALGVLAGAAARRIEVFPKRGGWSEPVNLWALAIAGTGERKSAVYSRMVKPLQEAESELRDSTAHARSVSESEQRAAEARVKHVEQSLARASGGKAQGEARAELDAAVAQARQIQDTSDPQLLSSDLTVQALPGLLARNVGRLIVCSAEPGLFDTLAGRYANGKEDISPILSSHSGDQLVVNRLGREGARVDRPALTMILTVQPARLSDLARIEGSHELGLMGRFMFSVTDSYRGTRKHRDAPAVPNQLRDQWTRLVRSLAEAQVPEEPQEVLLAGDAAERFAAWHDDELEPRLAPDEELGSERFAGWSGKYAGAVLRIAGLLHVADHAEVFQGSGVLPEIPLSTLERALTLGAYFEIHALAAHEMAGAGKAQAIAARIVAKGERGEWQAITERELFSGLKGSSSDLKMEHVDEALGELERRGYLQRIARKGRTKPPSRLCVWNPALRKQVAQEIRGIWGMEPGRYKATLNT